ncbi:MAG: 1,4-alpha-glucan branching enzyme, partial [Negativicutes bacterium]|nr:1,4-alpha-glucan branching enzyme [Negativicutes bacterium]
MQLLQPDEYNLYLFAEGSHCHSYRLLGAHLTCQQETAGVRFAVWAPNARHVAVVGDFNGWDGCKSPMKPVGNSGIWTLFIPGAAAGDLYKYEIHTAGGEIRLKADPFAFYSEKPPGTASKVWRLDYAWHDGDWREKQARYSPYDSPMLIYEVHLGSWRRHPDG